MGAAMIAAVSMGLSIDSSIHYIAGVRRGLAAGQPFDEALALVKEGVGQVLSEAVEGQDVTRSVDLGEYVAPVIWDEEFELDCLGIEPIDQCGEEPVDALPGLSRDELRGGMQAPEALFDRIIDGVDLVVDHELIDIGCSDLIEHDANRRHLVVRVGIGGIDKVDEQVGIRGFLECRAEGLDEFVGEITHESDGVGDQSRVAVREFELPHGGVECRKEAILDEDPCVGQAIEQRRLASIRVAHDRDHRFTG